MFIEKLAKRDGVIKFQHKRLIEHIATKDLKLYKFIDKYFFNYCKFNNISINDVIKIRKKFLKNYLENLKKFKLHKSYKNIDKNLKLQREDYDVILLLSFLIEAHRFKIAQLLSKEKFVNDILIIGSGPSLEIAIIKLFLKKKVNIQAYDLNFNNFVKKKFKKQCIQKEYCFKSKKFNSILIIEFLEHLSNPYKFLNYLKKSLKKNGKIIFTTAINIPQFDHLFNFKKRAVLGKLKKLGLKKIFFKSIDHKILNLKINSKNEYIVVKNAR